MEGSTGAPDPKPRTFSQVVFTDTPYSYPPSTPVTCCFTLTAAFQPSPRDWVGIFKVGWSTTKDYHTFVWVEPSLDVVGQETAMRQAVFKEYYLPKDEIEFYQFCYVDGTGQVRGASTPFCFKRTEEQSLESSPDDDLLVITTQEQVEQSIREKAELQKELDQIRAEYETLKINLQKTQQEAASLKGQNDQKEKENSQLGREMDQIKQQNESLKSTVQQQQQETESLKEEMLSQMKKQMEIQQQHDAAEKQTQSFNLDGDSRPNNVQEKYDRAVMKINQMKEEREQLKGRVDVQGVEIVLLNSKLREQERELLKMKDSVQLLQVDLQSTEKEKERLSAEMQKLQILTHNVDGLQTENRELCRRLSEQEALQSCPDDDLRVKCQSLVGQLQDAQTKLAAEREETKNIKRHNEFLDGELLQLRGQMEKVVEVCEQTERRSGKQEMQLREAHEAIADKNMLIEEKEHLMMLVKQEREELARENQTLMSDIEGLRRVNADLSAAPPRADTPQSQPDPTSPAAAAPPAQEQAETVYENIGILAEEGEEEEEQSLVCRHCQECFPGITRHELEQHEQSHRVCPFCTVICDNMEQAVFEDHVYGHEL